MEVRVSRRVSTNRRLENTSEDQGDSPVIAILLGAFGDGTKDDGHNSRRATTTPLCIGNYAYKCPNPAVDVESIVQGIVWKTVAANPAIAAKLLRLHFHDCFVQGCDGSILLTSTATNTAERDAAPNQSIEGFDVIDNIKTSLELVCPGVVSCADIVALAARDSVSFQFGKRLWEVYTGRKDGVVSLKSEAIANLPLPFHDFSTLLTNFQNHKLDLVDLVALSGGHTIGISHCGTIFNRLYNFTGKGETDPDLDPTYAQFLKTNCPITRPASTVGMDPNSSFNFDTNYFSALRQRKGIFTSDAVLLKNPRSAALVQLYQDKGAFFTQFVKSMVKMGNIGVLTGTQGQIRRKCDVVN